MDRRTFIRTAGVGGVIALAGCGGGNGTGGGGNGNGTGGGNGETTTGGNGGTGTTTGGAKTTTARGTVGGTLRVATYSSFTGEGTAGNYLKSAFEEAHSGVTVEFTVPSNGVNQYIQRKKQGAPIDADLYVGLNTGELVRAEETLDSRLFARSRDAVPRASAVKSNLEIDPEGRAIPYDTGYICLVYDEDEVQGPFTFDALLEPEYEGDLITQNAQSSDPGRAFLLWTIDAKGEDGYLDYWSGLVDNGVRILDDWEPAYNAYIDGEAPMVVSYSTDQVYYHGPDVDMSRHQVGFINDQGYANPEAMARFVDSDNAETAREFMNFVLQPEHQSKIAVKNVQFPAVTDANPGEKFSKYAYEPPEAVTFTYDQLLGNVERWIDRWARQVATN